MTEAFRNAARNEGYFYNIDGHFTPKGNTLYAQLIDGPLDAAIRNAKAGDGCGDN